MNSIHRRQFLRTTSRTAMAGLVLPSLLLDAATDTTGRKFHRCLDHRKIGIKAPLKKLIPLATKFGFESIAPTIGELGRSSASELENLQEEMLQNNLRWGASGLTVDIRTDSEEKYKTGLKELPVVANLLKRVGANRVRTYITPRHNRLTYRQNFRRYTERIREVATILDDAGLRLGLEYVAPRHLRMSGRFTFLYTLVETRELIAEIGKSNLGVVLDSFHWHNARETGEDILQLKDSEIISCDLNDAPVGKAIEALRDAPRALPASTGVIDLKTFVGALIKISYSGPVQVEPMLIEFRDMPTDAVLRQTADSLQRTLDLLT